MSKFQLILTGVFGFFLVLGIVVFSAYRGSSQDRVTVVVWGTMPQFSFAQVLQQTPLYQSKQYDVQYVEKSEADFDSDFIEALASGGGPDLFMINSEKLWKHYNKIFPVPFNVFTERQFKDIFIEGGEIFMSPKGVLAMPVLVDPLVMYWNRSIFTDANLTEPPKYWDQFYSLANTISKKDGALNILKSAVAFGEFGNISHAKEILVNLAMQAGSPVTQWNKEGVQIAWSGLFGKPIPPAEAAVNFFTEFGNPSKSSYSWNRSLPNSTNYFLGGDLALYFGFASEARNLQLRNPNLNFDVAEMPVSREGGLRVSFANYTGFAITKASPNKNAALAVALNFSGKEGVKAFSEISKQPPARRDLLGVKPTTAHESVFYASAIKSKTWLDPDPDLSNGVFRAMIDAITSGRSRTNEAIERAQLELTRIIGSK